MQSRRNRHDKLHSCRVRSLSGRSDLANTAGAFDDRMALGPFEYLDFQLEKVVLAQIQSAHFFKKRPVWMILSHLKGSNDVMRSPPRMMGAAQTLRLSVTESKSAQRTEANGQPKITPGRSRV